MDPSAYDFWLFDLDGTVVDAEWEYVRTTFDAVGDRLDYRFSDRQATVLWHGLTGPRDPTLREWGVDPAAFWPAFHDVEDPQRRAEHSYVHDDARFVADLDAPVGVVTHCQEFLARPVLAHLGVADWFDAVVCCTDETGWKPDPAPVERAMDRLDADGADAGVLAGDAASDVGAAWNAGLDAVHVERHDPHERGHCVRADHRVRRFTDLPGVAERVASDGGTADGA